VFFVVAFGLYIFLTANRNEVMTRISVLWYCTIREWLDKRAQVSSVNQMSGVGALTPSGPNGDPTTRP
jgi:hypothetical protein